MLGSPQLVMADATYKLGATAGVDYNSNLFDIAKGVPLPEGVSTRYDTIQDYSASGEANLTDPVGSILLQAKATRFDYEHNSYLAHTEETFGGLLRWHPGTVFDLQLQYGYERAMAPFAQTLTTALALDTSQSISAVIGVNLTPVWRLELNPTDHIMDTPLLGLSPGPGQPVVNFPNFNLEEKGGSVSLNYLGQAHMTAGLQLSYADGVFSQIAEATKYTQYGIAFLAKYKVNDLSNLTATIGYTSRNTVANPAGSLTGGDLGGLIENFVGDVGKTGGLTGNIAYTHTLSPKTTIDLNAFRNLVTYIAGANTMLATGVSADVTWRPDSKFDFTVGGQWEEDDFLGQVIGEPISSRVDHAYSAHLRMHYAVFPWLYIGPNITYTERDSNYALAGYSGYDAGVYVSATLQ